MIVCGALVGVPTFHYWIFIAACLLTCACLQHWFPSTTDPEVNLAVPIVALVLSLSIYASRRCTGRMLLAMNEQTLARAQRRAIR